MKRVSHVGVLVRDLEASIAQWSKIFGFQPIKRMDVPSEGLRSVFLSPDGTSSAFLIELVEVVDPDDLDNPIASLLNDRGEGLMHLCMIDEDTTAFGAELQEMGVKFAARPTSTGRGDDRLILSRKATNGALVEILSAREWGQVWE